MAELDVPDVDDGLPMNTAALLEGLTLSDDAVGAVPPELVQLALTHGPAALQAWIQENVHYLDEQTETFMSPAFTLAMGAGDCDDSERALVAIARAAGWQARLVYFMTDGQPSHVSAQIKESPSQPWMWAETTIAARYGEFPLTALARLGIPRADIGGTPYVLQNGRAVELKGMGKMSLRGLPTNLGTNFVPTLVAQSKTIGASPLDILKLLLSESGLQPTAWNPNGFASGEGAAGINQLAPVNYGYITNAGYTPQGYLQLTAEQQLPVAFAYFAAVMSGAGLSSISGRDLYWLNFLPATYVKDALDSHVIVSSSSGYYTNNTGLDHGSKGYITAGDLQKSLDAQESSQTYQLLAPAILAANPLAGASLPIAMLLVGGAIAVGAYLADPAFVRNLV
jgi:hypothetical protein